MLYTDVRVHLQRSYPYHQCIASDVVSYQKWLQNGFVPRNCRSSDVEMISSLSSHATAPGCKGQRKEPSANVHPAARPDEGWFCTYLAVWQAENISNLYPFFSKDTWNWGNLWQNVWHRATSSRTIKLVEKHWEWGALQKWFEFGLVPATWI